QHRQPGSGRGIVGEDRVEVAAAVAIDVQSRRVVQVAADPRAGGVAVEVGAPRRLTETIGDELARDVAEVGDVVRGVVERQRIDRRAVLEGGVDFAETFGRGALRLHEYVAFRHHQR